MPYPSAGRRVELSADSAGWAWSALTPGTSPHETFGFYLQAQQTTDNIHCLLLSIRYEIPRGISQLTFKRFFPLSIVVSSVPMPNHVVSIVFMELTLSKMHYGNAKYS